MSKNDRNAEESRRILTRMAQESDPTGSLATKAARHMAAADADQNDRVEVWGTRIGRVIGVILLIVLVIYLASMIADA